MLRAVIVYENAEVKKIDKRVNNQNVEAPVIF